MKKLVTCPYCRGTGKGSNGKSTRCLKCGNTNHVGKIWDTDPILKILIKK